VRIIFGGEDPPADRNYTIDRRKINAVKKVPENRPQTKTEK
jgi:hypothetical protein